MPTPAAATDTSHTCFDLLGPVVVTVAGSPVRLGGPRQVAVLARLLLNAGPVVSMEQLSESIWDGDCPARPEVAIRSYISNLRRSIEPNRHPGDRRSCIESCPPGYRLVVAPAQIDAHRFEWLLKEGRQRISEAKLEAAVASLSQARSLWRGEPCEGLIDTDVLLGYRARMSELHLVTAELLFEARLGLGEHETVLPDLEASVAEHPLRERLTELAMLALYRAGRQSEALAACQRLRRRLIDKLGIDPGPPIQALEHKILTHDASLISLASAPRTGSAAAAPGINRPPGAHRGDLVVGRTRQLALLAGLETSLEQGRSASALITGEPGSGKSTLVARLAEGLATAGIRPSWGRCRAVAHEQMLWPWGQILEDLAGMVDDEMLDGLQSLRALAPSLDRGADWRNSLHHGPANPTQASTLFPAVTELLRRVSAIRPILIVVEDAHWADEATIELLAFGGAALAEHPVGFAVTWRDTEVDAVSARLALRDLARMPAMTRIELAGLTAEAIEELLEPSRPGRRPLARALQLVTAGNPFLVKELIAGLDLTPLFESVLSQSALSQSALSQSALSEFGEPDEGDDSELASALLRLAPSTNIQEFMLHRVERAHPDALAGLSVGALTCRSFSAELVAEAAGLETAVAEEVLDQAARAGLLAEDEPDRQSYRFVHPVAAQALISDLSGPRRARLHAAIGQALWRHGGGPADLAFHFSRAGSTGTSILAARFALESVRANSQPELLAQAETVVIEGLEALQSLGGTDGLETELAMFLAQIARLRGDDDRQRAMANRALVAAQHTSNPELEALAALATTGSHPTGSEFATVIWAGQDLGPPWAGSFLASCASRIGLDHRWGPALAARLARFQSQPVASPSPPTSEPGWVAWWREQAAALLARGVGGARWELANQFLDHGEGSGAIHDHLLAARLGLASAEHPAGWALVDRVLDETEAEVERQPGSLASFDLALTGVARDLIRGRLAEVSSSIAAGALWCRRSGVDPSGSLDRQRLALYWEQGRFAEIEQAATADADGLVWRAVAAGEAGDTDRACRLLETVADSDRRLTASHCLLALAAHRAGHPATAAATLAPMLTYRDSLASMASGLVILGPVSYFAALAAATLGRLDLARELLIEAGLLARRLDAPTWLIRILVAQAELSAANHDWSEMELTLAEAKTIAAETATGWLDGWLSRPGLQSSSNPFAIR